MNPHLACDLAIRRCRDIEHAAGPATPGRSAMDGESPLSFRRQLGFALVEAGLLLLTPRPGAAARARAKA